MACRFRNWKGRLLVWLLSFVIVGCRTYASKVDETSSNNAVSRIESSTVTNHFEHGNVYDSTHVDYKLGTFSAESCGSVRVDTIVKYQIRYRYLRSNIKDTIFVSKTDTIRTTRTVHESETKNYLMSYADLFIFLLILAGILIFFYSAKKPSR